MDHGMDTELFLIHTATRTLQLAHGLRHRIDTATRTLQLAHGLSHRVGGIGERAQTISVADVVLFSLASYHVASLLVPVFYSVSMKRMLG